MKLSHTLALFGTSFLLVAGCMDGPDENVPTENVGSFEAASLVPTATIVTGTATASNSTSPKTATATCAAGQRVLGGGGTITNNSHIVITRLEPVHPGSGSDSYQMDASEDEVGTAGNWSIQAFAICASPPTGLTIVSASTATASGSFQNVKASCATGSVALGGGGKITGGNGQVDLSVTIDGGAFNPNAVGGAGEEDANGFSGNWSATAFAVCAPSSIFGDAQRATNITATDSTSPKTVTATCPAGTGITGGAGFIGSPAAVVDSVTYNAGRTSVTVTGHEQVATASIWDLSVYAACAK